MLRGQAVLARGFSLARPRTAPTQPATQPPAPARLAAPAAAGLRSALHSLASYAAGVMRQRGAATASASALPEQHLEAAGADAPAADPAAAAADPAAADAADAPPPTRRKPGRPRKDGLLLVPGSPKPKKRPRLPEASLYVTTNLRQLQPKAAAIGQHLGKLYPSPPIPLDHASPFQLLCAVLLSAQTTDKKVNEATPALFALAPDPPAMAAAEVAAIAACIRQLGLAPTKAKNLRAMAQALLRDHGGAVPASFEALEALPGVGHKTASVVMAQAHGAAAFPVDTHIHRLAQRWGLTGGKSVEQTEADLKVLFPPATWRDLHLQIIFFGREKCPARGHNPAECPICAWAAVSPYDKSGKRAASPVKKRAAAAGAAAAEAEAEAKPKRRRKSSGGGDEAPPPPA